MRKVSCKLCTCLWSVCNMNQKLKIISLGFLKSWISLQDWRLSPQKTVWGLNYFETKLEKCSCIWSFIIMGATYFSVSPHVIPCKLRVDQIKNKRVSQRRSNTPPTCCSSAFLLLISMNINSKQFLSWKWASERHFSNVLCVGPWFKALRPHAERFKIIGHEMTMWTIIVFQSAACWSVLELWLLTLLRRQP